MPPPLVASRALIADFFAFAIQEVLRQRNVLPASDFHSVRKFGLDLHVTTDRSIQRFLGSILSQLQTFLAAGLLQRVVLEVVRLDADLTVLERWSFSLREKRGTETERTSGGDENARPGATAAADEVAALMRQISASVSFMPMIEDECSFDILFHTSKDADIPATWEDAQPRLVEPEDRQDDQMRSFSTSHHEVTAHVSYLL